MKMQTITSVLKMQSKSYANYNVSITPVVKYQSVLVKVKQVTTHGILNA